MKEIGKVEGKYLVIKSITIKQPGKKVAHYICDSANTLNSFLQEEITVVYEYLTKIW